MKKQKKSKSVKAKSAPKFDIQISYNGPGAAGHDFTVTVKALNTERICKVVTFLDGYTIGDDKLSPPNSSYKREFYEEGSYTPGKKHTVIVVVTGTTVVETGSLVWTDRLKPKKTKK